MFSNNKAPLMIEVSQYMFDGSSVDIEECEKLWKQLFPVNHNQWSTVIANELKQIDITIESIKKIYDTTRASKLELAK
jgi:hypothetical protein